MKSSKWAILALLLAVVVLPARSQTAKPREAATPARATTRAAAPRSAAPSTQHLDGIAAVVNDEVVLQSDVEEQLYLFITNNQIQPDSVMVDTLRRQILDEMINEKLIVDEAKRQGIVMTDAEVNREVERAVQDAKDRFGPEGFQQQLAKENMTEEQLRAKFRDSRRRDLTARRLVEKQLPQKAVSQAEAEAYFKANPDKFPKAPPQARLSLIQIPVTPDSAADQAGRARALEIRRRILAGEKFAKVAGEVSDDPGTAKSGGDLGFFTRGTMEPSIDQAAFSLKLDELSEPVHSPYGWHLLQVLDRDTLKTAARTDSLDAAGKPLLEAHVRHILVRIETTEADRDRARAQATRVRGEAVKGVDFATLVRRYSKYQGPATPDGDVGFVPMSTLLPQIRAGLDTLEVGQVSEVLENQAGFNIFKVTDRRPERPYTLEEIRDQLPDAVAQIKFRERYAEWVKSLRVKAHIEIRNT